MRDKEGKEGKKGITTKNFVIAILIIGSLTFVGVFLVPWSTLFPPEPTVTPILGNSSITMTDWTSRENLGELCPVTVRGDKGDITETEHIYDITYYEIIKTEVMPNDFDEDLSEYNYIMITPNPDEATDGYWTTYDYLYANLENNFVYNMFAYHEATDMYGNILNVTDGQVWHLSTDGNYTIPLWYPPETFTELHRGTHFTIEDDLDDLSASTIARLQNEKFYRSMPTLYTLTDDTTDHDLSGEYSMITETFAIKFDFNASISSTDAATTQVNFTAECDVDHLIEIVDDMLYVVTTETWDTLLGNFELFFEITMGTHIICENVFAGRVVVPNRFFDASITFTSMQTLA